MKYSMATWGFFLAVALIMLPDAVWAQAVPATGTANASRIQEVICDLVALIQTDMGQAVATAALLALGIQALLGRVSWGMAMVIVAGMGVMYGAGGIVLAMTGIEGCPDTVMQNANTP